MSWTSPLTVPMTNVPIGFAPVSGEQRAQDVERALHRPRRDQHLGDEEVAALEPRADLLQRGDQPFVEHPLRVEPLLETELGQLAHRRRVADQRVVEEALQDLVMRHAAPRFG